MSGARLRTGAGAPAGLAAGGDRAAIIGPAQHVADQPANRATLSPAQVAASLLHPNMQVDTRAVLTGFLGQEFTTGNIAWSRYPVGAMRALQKAILNRAIGLDGPAKDACLAALSVVERNVQWRLRLQQMEDCAQESGTPTSAGTRREKT